MSSNPQPPQEKGSSLAIKAAWITVAGGIVAALLGGAATLGGAQIQSGAENPGRSATLGPTTSTNNHSTQPSNRDSYLSPSTPSPSESPADKPATSQALPPTMVRDLVSIDQETGDTWEITKGDIDGKSYPDSLWSSTCSIIQTSQQTYIIRKGYKKFKAKVGIDDSSERASPVYFSVIADGGTIYHRKVYPGAPASIDVSISDTVRLILSIEIDDYDSNCNKTYAIWADARLEK
ncbi:NPCBM/NEW2 domain-containing protein [Nonomuraea sp. NEAU-A123]|uniref:NPCBM/NEW2 domain-containing protein n=1 Tax=Nonomuraea sp. NEAU-A123 TaxID=2839649 RepID=UPI001BE49EF7|nr:NPCBM/NEW2 domain-containing protein [Nonomuraea sp. NEAU-A123]MBT2234725.1 NPCBM/NEW2 domain-containing protein [Nonomuraea sp. NEAU-A123]